MNERARIPVDQALRQRALQPGRSFLVQAPAGSGKTELLIQRFLRLLATVEEPEEILAITFTRKAAAEMRSRILAALERARHQQRPDEAHLLLGYELALVVVARDAERNWNLLEQPGRLRVGTIDSVNAWLSGRAPLSAGSLAQFDVVDEASALYVEAARETVALAADKDDVGTAARALLAHCDNRAELVVRHLVGMLARRDQWLRHTGPGLAGDAQRAALEQSLAALIEGFLEHADNLLPPGSRGELTELLAFAAENRFDAGEDAAGLAWRGAADFPAPTAAEVARWRSLAQALLTKNKREPAWRKPGGLNVRQGFPPTNKLMKERMGELLESLAGVPGLLDAVRPLLSLPDPRYRDEQWSLLKYLLRLLPVAVALLQGVFQARGQTDFNQVASDAMASLGADDSPTELSLILDYRLRHLLLDEFQDTSRSQYDLLQRLTAGWEPDDGRTAFLVGDPMQSIYRFREAEVGVYLEACVGGLGHLPLEFLRLETNFRSDPQLVDWTNRVFADLLPPHDDLLTGAVGHAPSVAFQSPQADSGIYWHAQTYGDRQSEARTVADLVRDCSERWPTQSVGVLVRSRAHVAALGPLLRAEGIDYSAPDLEILGEHALVQDLLGLTRALVHPGDRIAWLALLRSPSCGLTLADLHQLAADDQEATIWSLLQMPDRLLALSPDGQQRVNRLVTALTPWLQRRGACCLRDLVEGAWLQLGGAAALDPTDEFELADSFFACLDAHDEGGDCADLPGLIETLDSRLVDRSAATARVQIMTMHKAKGLEFDTVILPGLGYASRSDSRPLLQWAELPGAAKNALVLAPLPAQDEVAEPVYELLWQFERQRNGFERDRLLYVATTRARRRLHLCAALRADADGKAAPAQGSLLAALWPIVADEIHIPADLVLPTRARGAAHEPAWRVVPLRRLPADWRPPLILQPPRLPTGSDSEAPEYEWASAWAKHVGTVVHRWLQELAHVGIERFDADRLHALRPTFAGLLTRLGTPPGDLDKAVTRTETALRNCLADSQAQWLLSAEHPESRSELAVTLEQADGFHQLRIDRVIETNTGERWIVDYKTSPHEGTRLDDFLISEQQRYAGQLRQYAEALNRIQPMPTKTALYFPLLGRLLETDSTEA
ncbi:MAG: UvrD-helicase domain-containing protein [Gammaproteobacteria bacterium]|nr:UvrD-helicase domain-containing protein [Gammaproteobacteria bacterium]